MVLILSNVVNVKIKDILSFNYSLEYLTIILRGRAGYEMIYNQRGAQRRVGYDHFLSSKPE